MARTWIPERLRQEAREHFHGRCAYCHSPQALLDGIFEVDHIVPTSAGGQTEASNLAFACPVCNRIKSARWQYPDPKTGHVVALFHPRRQRWNRHFQWSPGGRHIEGRTACGRATVDALRLNSRMLVNLREVWMQIHAAPPEWEPGLPLE